MIDIDVKLDSDPENDIQIQVPTNNRFTPLEN
jgi:hypothetical protein